MNAATRKCPNPSDTYSTEREANQSLSNWAESEAYEKAQWMKVLAAPRSNAVPKPAVQKSFFSKLFGV